MNINHLIIIFIRYNYSVQLLLDMSDKKGFVKNPSTGRYVKITGKVGMKLLASKISGDNGTLKEEKDKPVIDLTTGCPPGKIRNPKTGKCVKISGSIGRKLSGGGGLEAIDLKDPIYLGKPVLVDTMDINNKNVICREDKIPNTKEFKAFMSTSVIKNSKIKPKPYQLRNIYRLTRKGVHGLGTILPTGAGKTLVAATIGECLLNKTTKDPNMDSCDGVICIFPKILRGNLNKELDKRGVTDKKKYEVFAPQKFVNTYHGKSKAELKKLFKKKLLIVDEAHALRTDTSKGKRSKFILEASKLFNKVLLLTATPMVNHLHEIRNLVAMIDGVNPLGEGEFENLISDEKKLKEYIGCKFGIYNCPRIEGWPSVKEYEQAFPMTSGEYKEYKEFEEGFGDDKAKLMAFLTGSRQATNTVSKLKADWIINKIKEGKKTLVFSVFIEKGIDVFKEGLEGTDIEYRVITGKTTPNKRDEYVKLYNEDKIKVLFISAAGGEGLDLKGTRYIILTEPTWNMATKQQKAGRGIRYLSHEHLPDDEKNVEIWNLYLVKPLSSRDKDSNESVDIFLRNKQKEKAVKIKNFMNKMEEYSIDNMNCFGEEEKDDSSIKEEKDSNPKEEKKKTKVSTIKEEKKVKVSTIKEEKKKVKVSTNDTPKEEKKKVKVSIKSQSKKQITKEGIKTLFEKLTEIYMDISENDKRAYLLVKRKKRKLFAPLLVGFGIEPSDLETENNKKIKILETLLKKFNKMKDKNAKTCFLKGKELKSELEWPDY